MKPNLKLEAILQAVQDEGLKKHYAGILNGKAGDKELPAFENAQDLALERDNEPPIAVRSTGWHEFNVMTAGGIAEGEAVLMSGWRGTGKTHFACCLAIKFLRQGYPVFYLTMEDGWRMIVDRMRTLSPDRENFELLTIVREEGVTAKNLTEILKVATDMHALIIVDNLFALPIEKADNIWEAQADWMDQICDAVRGTTSSVLVLHHLNKGKDATGESWRIAGSTRLQNRPGQVWLMTQDPEDPRRLMFKCDKNRRALIQSPVCALHSDDPTGMLKGYSPLDTEHKPWVESAQQVFSGMI